jgi:hypothetical protein
MLVSREAASDVDTVEQSWARSNPSERGGCRVPGCVDPERRTIIQQQVINDDRLQDGDPTVVSDIEECDPLLKYGKQGGFTRWVGLLDEIVVAVCAANWRARLIWQ